MNSHCWILIFIYCSIQAVRLCLHEGPLIHYCNNMKIYNWIFQRYKSSNVVQWLIFSRDYKSCYYQVTSDSKAGVPALYKSRFDWIHWRWWYPFEVFPLSSFEKRKEHWEHIVVLWDNLASFQLNSDNYVVLNSTPLDHQPHLDLKKILALIH